MRKKILFGLGIVALLVTTNVSLIKNEQSAELSLKSLASIPQAQAEYEGRWIVTIYSPTHWKCDNGGGVCCPSIDC